MPRISLMGDEKAAFVHDQSRGGVGMVQETTQDVIELLDVFLEQLGKGAHVMRTGVRVD